LPLRSMWGKRALLEQAGVVGWNDPYPSLREGTRAPGIGA
jgi:hypothetical protein